MFHGEEKERILGLLVGLGLAALILLLASQAGHHGVIGPRGPLWRPYGPGLLPIVGIGLLALLLGAAFHVLPLLLLVGAGYVLYRWFSGRPVQISAASGPWHGHGPGAHATPVEPGIFCPSCGGAVSREWATCPSCGYRKYVAPDLIQRKCSNCGTYLQKDWHACPYCSTRIDPVVTITPPGPAAEPPGGGSAGPSGETSV